MMGTQLMCKEAVFSTLPIRSSASPSSPCLCRGGAKEPRAAQHFPFDAPGSRLDRLRTRSLPCPPRSTAVVEGRDTGVACCPSAGAEPCPLPPGQCPRSQVPTLPSPQTQSPPGLCPQPSTPVALAATSQSLRAAPPLQGKWESGLVGTGAVGRGSPILQRPWPQVSPLCLLKATHRSHLHEGSWPRHLPSPGPS